MNEPDGTREPVPVLVVDDEPANRLALASLLRGAGYEVLLAESGADALAQLLRREAVVIVLDVTMPGLDGFQTASIIRERDRSSRVPILFTTAAPDTQREVFRRFPGGLVDALVKPADPDELLAKVATFAALGRPGPTDGPTSTSSVGEDVLASVAHELRTPLMPMRIALDALSSSIVQTDLEPRTRERLQQSLDRTERALHRLMASTEDVLEALRAGRPVASQAPRPPAPSTSTMHPGTHSPPPGVAPAEDAILIVDDDSEIRAALTDAFEHAGYHVVTAENGRDALDRLSEMPRPAVILLDWMMPVMDGPKFLAELRTLPLRGDVPVVVMSAGGRESMRGHEKAHAFLKKPVALRELFAIVERFTGRDESTAAGGEAHT